MMRRFLLVLSLFGILLMAHAAPAAAWDPFGGVSCTGSNSHSAVCTDKKQDSNPVSGQDGLLPRAISVISIVAGVIAVIVILVGSIKYITSAGDSSAAASARGTVINALIGLAVIVIARTLILYVINKVSKG